MLADGDAHITDVNWLGATAMLSAAMGFNSLPTLKWLLEEGGARITERDSAGHSALFWAAASERLTTCQWLLEHGGADIMEVNHTGRNIWHLLGGRLVRAANAAELTALLQVMVLRSAPPPDFMAQLRPEHVRVVEEGARLKEALPAYLARRRALLDSHCPLIAPLRDLVRDYDPEPTTTEELWATGLGAAPQCARCPRPEADVTVPVRRSARLRQRLEC
jgi:hypothetical protein